MKKLFVSLIAFLGLTIAASAQCATGYTQLSNVFACQLNSGGTSVTLDADATAPFVNAGTAISTINFTNLTVGTGHSNYALIVQFHGNNNGITSATWGTQSMRKITTFTSHGNTAELWGLIAPQSGNKTLSVTLNGSAVYCALNASSWYNVNQTGGSTTFYNAANSSGTGTAMSISLASQTSDAVVEVDGNDSIAGTHAPLGNALFIANPISPAGSWLPGAPSVTLGWTAGGSTDWSMVAAGMKHS